MTANPFRIVSRRAEPLPEADMLAALEESVTRTDAWDSPAKARSGQQPVIARSARFSIAISRALGSVVVTVHGTLDGPGARHLGSVLADIIDGQGNLAVIVDLHNARALDAGGLSVFVTAAERAGRRGAALTLRDPPVDFRESLSLLGIAHLVQVAHHDGGRPSPSAHFGRICPPEGSSGQPAARSLFPGHLRGA